MESGPERTSAETSSKEKKVRKLSKEEEQDAQIGLLEWEIELLGVDHLTGLKTRKFFDQELERSLEKIREEKKGRRDELQKISLIFIDLDHFKQINDTFGHPAGDEVLRKVSALLADSVRDFDIVARLGGEELAILMREANVEVAARLAENLRTEIEKIVFEADPALKVTASFGIASSEGAADAKTLYARADSALYVAKKGGRNRVEVYR